MAQAQAKFTTFEAYLSCSNDMDIEGRYELINGELVELPPESRLNSTIAVRILLLLVAAGISVELIHPGKCEVQVPILRSNDAANRFPDLVVLRPEHLELTQRRLTITLDMPPPRLIAEVVSPGKTNRDRDYIHKRAQYAAIGVPEYWLIDPVAQTVMVLSLEGEDYREIGVFSGEDAIASLEFTELKLTAGQIFETEI
ncbi:MAG: Uma2 family endonuclease [Drouetiella hepatica Uher 2000/2452]|jgi:Uma2 family endonuclease|uniref:Uma2 family endonuclease n=1 Tax=Drouetiella hepatica Uher 2000/2452 TaxID=904376 RepID=A0A951UNJ0_9CYAN|nr:Uma2 family endonuclease [Drouetiella hepatica Uher 2000/2452]